MGEPTEEPSITIATEPTVQPTAGSAEETTNEPTEEPTVPAPTLMFETQELFTTGFSVTVEVGHGVGFGGLTMSAGTSAAIYTGTDTLDSRYFDATGLGSSFGESYWTVSSYVA